MCTENETVLTPPETEPRLYKKRILAPLALVLLVAGAIAVALVFRTLSENWIVDDAYISFRYAENLASGNGLVFNAGERVEGYTNFSWTALLALASPLGLSLEGVALALGLAFHAAAVALAWLLAVELVDGPRAGLFALLAPLGLVFSFPSSAWAFGGLETPLFTALLLAAIMFHLRERPLGAGLLFGALALTRPEGSLVFAVAWTVRFIEVRKLDRKQFLLSAGFLALFLPHELFRILYYGDAVPNTFYAKVGLGLHQLGRGLEYLGFFAVDAAAYVFAPVLFAPKTWTNKKRRLLVILVIVYLAYIVYAGSDPLPAFRFPVPLIPLMLALLAAAAHSTFVFLRGRRLRALPWVVLPGFLGLFALWCFFGAWEMFYGGENIYKATLGIPVSSGRTLRHLKNDKIARHGEIIGRWLRENGEPTMTVALNSAGGIPYFSGMNAVDMLGLTDRHIARREVPGFGGGFVGHEKYDAQYCIARIPDFFVFGSASYTRPVFPGDHVIIGNYAFRDLYHRRGFVENGHAFTLWRLRNRNRAASYRDLLEASLRERDFELARLAVNFAEKEFPMDKDIADIAAEIRAWREVGKAFDFESGTWEEFELEGEAFGPGPAKGTLENQAPVLEFRGRFLVNTYFNGSDLSTGTAVSEPFIVEGDVLTFRIGGGRDPDNVALQLVNENGILCSATGRGDEILRHQFFDVSPWKGRKARLLW